MQPRDTLDTAPYTTARQLAHDPEAALYNSSIESGVTGWFVGFAPWLVTSSLGVWVTLQGLGFERVTMSTD